MKQAEYENPDWTEGGKVHNWRNYVSEAVRAMWGTFTVEQKAAIAASAQENADREEWD